MRVEPEEVAELAEVLSKAERDYITIVVFPSFKESLTLSTMTKSSM